MNLKNFEIKTEIDLGEYEIESDITDDENEEEMLSQGLSEELENDEEELLRQAIALSLED